MKKTCCVLLACFAVTFPGCADLTVSKVTPVADLNILGLRYSLPKPFIQVVPQGDGTISVSVVYLPDSENTYAIDISSFMSSYTFQVSLDQNGLLNAVEFKKSTSAIGQQVAATSSAITAQVLNTWNAQLLAAQTALDTAQSAVDTAQVNRDTAQKKLDLLRANQAPASDILNAQIALEQAAVQLTHAQQVLDRAKNTSRAVQMTASTGTPISTSPPTPSSTGFGMPTWTPLPSYNISGKRGAVLFAVNDYTDGNGENIVELKAAKIDKDAQHTFETTGIALGPPTLKPQGFTFPVEGTAVFMFNQDVTKILSRSLKPPTNVKLPKAELKNSRTVEMSLKGLPKGNYTLSLECEYQGRRVGISDVTFSIN